MPCMEQLTWIPLSTGPPTSVSVPGLPGRPFALTRTPVVAARSLGRAARPRVAPLQARVVPADRIVARPERGRDGRAALADAVTGLCVVGLGPLTLALAVQCARTGPRLGRARARRSRRRQWSRGLWRRPSGGDSRQGGSRPSGVVRLRLRRISTKSGRQRRSSAAGWAAHRRSERPTRAVRTATGAWDELEATGRTDSLLVRARPSPGTSRRA